MQKNGPLALAFNALVITFMLAPLLVVCIVAFTPHNTLTLPTTEFSLRWFKAVFAHSDFVQSFWNSLWLALASATLATVLAVPAGIAITRYEFAGRGFLNGLFLSPLIIPHLVLGVALLRLFALLGARAALAGWCLRMRSSLRPTRCGWWWPRWWGLTAVPSMPRCRWVPARPRCSHASRCR